MTEYNKIQVKSEKCENQSEILKIGLMTEAQKMKIIGVG